MSLKLVKAIIDQARTNSDLVLSVQQPGTSEIRFGVFFNEAPPEAKMPYITFSIVSHTPINDFCTNLNKTFIQMDIWDKNRDLNNMALLEGYVNDTFNRVELPFTASSDSIGCILAGEVGPMKEDDCWHKINEYRIHYK